MVRIFSYFLQLQGHDLYCRQQIVESWFYMDR